VSNVDRAYSFVLKGLLTEEALDRAGRINSRTIRVDEIELARLVGLDALDEQRVNAARAMAVIYTAIAAFENSVRELISKTLLEAVGENWWATAVSEKIQKAAAARMAEEEKIRWHAQRGADPIQYTMLPNLINIIRQNFAHFEPFIHNVDWAANIFDAIERSRNVIMHSGTLGPRDIARVGSLINDWARQVAT
jgi:hypothetical protein